MSKVALVTGAGRGIGLELCRQLLERGYDVIAAPRTSGSEGLAGLMAQHPKRLSIVTMDVSDKVSVAAAAKGVAEKFDHLDLLINNGAIYPKGAHHVESAEFEEIGEAFDVNAIGPLRVTQALLPLLRSGEGKRVIQITSLMGSMSDNGSGGSYAYRMSKAALNMATRNLAHDLKGEGFTVLCIHPGWVQTRMGGAAAPLELAAATMDVLDNALETPAAETGSFKGPGRRPLPW